MILGLTIKAEYHWGYWIRVPYSSKLQLSLPLPPPTTLLGALASGLVREGLLKGPNGERLSGELLITSIKVGRRGRVDFRSPASLLDDALITASAALSDKKYAFITEDVNRYVTLLFQEAKIPEKVGEEMIPRRYLPKYRTGAICCGKVYYPSGPIEAVYLFDLAKLENIVDGDPAHALEIAAWNINRIGSKESLVTIKKVSCMELSKSDIGKGVVKTKFYFPSSAGRALSGPFYTEVFWRRGWGRLDPPIFEEYVIPGSRTPISSSEILVEAKVYIDLGDRVRLIFPAPGG
jgi:CRISPR-associated protein Cas5a/b/c